MEMQNELKVEKVVRGSLVFYTRFPPEERATQLAWIMMSDVVYNKDTNTILKNRYTTEMILDSFFKIDSKE